MRRRKNKERSSAGPAAGHVDRQAILTGVWALRRPTLVAFAVIAAVSVLAFANSLGGEFVRDDLLIILLNPMVRGFSEIGNILVSDYWASTRISDQLYRPLLTLSYLANYSIGGTDPFGYHLFNLLVHVLTAVGVYQLAVRLRLRWDAALLAGMLFAVHPIHTEAVDPVTGRADLLATLAVLLALNWYIDLDRNRAMGLPRMFGSWGAFAAGLLCKETAIVLPGLLVLYEIYAADAKRSLSRVVRDKGALLAGYLLIAAIYLAIRWAVLGGLYRASGAIPFLDNPIAAAAWDNRIANAAMIAGKYLLLFVWPIELSTDYSYDAIPLAASAWDVRVLASASVWLGLCALAVWSYRRGSRFAFFAVGYLVITFLPVSNLILPIGTIMGERLFYMPSVGLCLLFAGSWQWGFQRFHFQSFHFRAVLCYALAVVVLLLLTGRTIVRNRDWHSHIGLWEAAARVVPDSAKVHYVLGVFAMVGGRFAEAAERYEHALEIYPEYKEREEKFAKYYGAVLLKLRRPDEALPYLEAAVKRWPQSAAVQLNLGLAYAGQESWEAAEAAFRKALVHDIENLQAHKGLIVALRKQGRYEAAIQAADEALLVDSGFRDARVNKAAALVALGRTQEARDVLLTTEASKREAHPKAK